MHGNIEPENLNIISEKVDNLQNLLDRYSTLDPPITITDSGNQCQMWNNYANGKYRFNQNTCLSIDNSASYKCISSTGSLETCDKMYQDGYINSKNKINNKPLVDGAINKITNALNSNNSELSFMDQEANKLINELSDRSKIQFQQIDIIKHNEENIQEKSEIINENNKKMSSKQNETNLNQLSFTHFINGIQYNDSLTKIYYKVFIVLIILVILIGFINFLFSNIL
jgi:hypothetical protein